MNALGPIALVLAALALAVWWRLRTTRTGYDDGWFVPGTPTGATVTRIDGETWRVTGKTIPEDLQTLLGAYAGGQEVTGIVQLREGLQVQYADGSSYAFIPVPSDGVLYVDAKTGEFSVRMPEDKEAVA